MVKGYEVILTLKATDVPKRSNMPKPWLNEENFSGRIMRIAGRVCERIATLWNSKQVRLPDSWDSVCHLCTFCNNVFGTQFKVADAVYSRPDLELKVTDCEGNELKAVMCELDEEGFEGRRPRGRDQKIRA